MRTTSELISAVFAAAMVIAFGEGVAGAQNLAAVRGAVTLDGETVANGVTVTLVDSSGNVRSTTTDLQGRFLFIGVPPQENLTIKAQKPPYYAVGGRIGRLFARETLVLYVRLVRSSPCDPCSPHWRGVHDFPPGSFRLPIPEIPVQVGKEL